MSADNWTDCPQCGGGRTLREDYEFYTANGVVNVSYDCSCECGFEDSFTHEHPFTIDPAIMADTLAYYACSANSAADSAAYSAQREKLLDMILAAI